MMSFHVLLFQMIWEKIGSIILIWICGLKWTDWIDLIAYLEDTILDKSNLFF